MNAPFPSSSLIHLYGPETAALYENQLRAMVPSQLEIRPASTNRGSVWLLAYPTHLDEAGVSGMQALATLLDHADDQFQHLHLLPPFLSAGDFGFAPADHFELENEAGTWEDLRSLCSRLPVSIDLILNHVAPSHPWAEAVLNGAVDEASDPFIRADPHANYSALARSKHHPPVSAYRAIDGVRHYWTRYGRTQIDLDYRKPHVLMRMAAVMIEYAARGVSGLRLDALAFIWKDINRPSANEPEVFHVLELLRWIADRSGLTTLIAEGDVRAGSSPYVTADARRASIAYRYEGAPVVLATLLRCNNSPLASWIHLHGSELHRTLALNFLSTHDGVYLRPHDPPTSPDDLEVLATATVENGGTVIERMVGDVTRPYELDIAIIDLLDGSGDGSKRLLAGITLICWIPGTPMIYLGHLLGVRNADDLVLDSGDERARNRGAVSLVQGLEAIRGGIGALVLHAVRDFRDAATAYDAFDPNSPISLGPDFGAGVISLIRTGRTSRILCLLALGENATVTLPSNYARGGQSVIELVAWQGVIVPEIGSVRESGA